METTKMIQMIQLDDIHSLQGGCIGMAAAGVASHLLYFIRGDHNPYAHRWITRGLTGIGLLAGAVLHLTRYRALQTAVMTGLFASTYFTALFTSILLYRLFFHVAEFPGPFLGATLEPLPHLCHPRV